MQYSRNLRAFQDMLAYSELGPDLLRESDNGYDVIVGSRPGRVDRFKSYADHPRKRVTLNLKGKIIVSTAAGRYQILARYFDHYRRVLDLEDFGPDSQDAIAVQLIRECKALADIEAGNLAGAVYKCRSRWASLPGAGYGQPEHPLAALKVAYTLAGGELA